MAKRAVKWTRTADIQFVGILHYWIKRNKSTVYSRKLIRLVAERTKEIAASPFIFRTTDVKETGVAPMGNFSIYFKVFDDSIIVTAFWDIRQDPGKLLKILKEIE